VTGRLGAARETDDRVSAPGILARLRPGPAGSIDPRSPSPRPPVPPSALHNRRLRIGSRYALQLAVQAGGRPAPPVPYTAADARGVSVVRRTIVGKAPPLSYRSQYVAPFRGSGASSETEDASGSGRTKLPCIDCD